MKRLILLLVLVASILSAQGYVESKTLRRFVRAASAPATCNPGDAYYNTTSDVGYLCTATDTWTIMGASGGLVAVTGASAAVGATNLVATAAAGLYRISGYMQTTTVSDAACTSDVTIGWTYNSDVKALEVASNHNQALDETYTQVPITTARVDGSSNITYTISLDAGGDCTNAAFDYYLVAERIQ